MRSGSGGIGGRHSGPEDESARYVLTLEAASPICPLGLIVELLGCHVTWQAGTCTVTHPTRGMLNVWLEDNCPTVSKAYCLSLIQELEQLRAGRLQQALQLRAFSLGVSLEGQEAMTDLAMMS